MGEPRLPSHRSKFERLKSAIVGFFVLSLLIGVLIAALVLGSILAVIIIAVVLLGAAVLLITRMRRRL